MNVVWLLNDLRLADNPALANALQDSIDTIVVYILDESYAWKIGSAQKWWLHYSLQQLQQALQDKNIGFYLFQGEYADVFKQLNELQAITAIYANSVFNPNVQKRQAKVAKWAKQQDIDSHFYIGNHLQHPSTPLNGQGSNYKVFTQFWKQSLKCLRERESLKAPRKLSQMFRLSDANACQLKDLQLLPSKPNWAKGFEAHWEPGEKGALKRLKQFVENGLSDYKDNRDRPDLAGVSGLSPHIHFGEISPWQVWHEVKNALKHKPGAKSGADTFLKQLGWREFSYHLLYHYHDLPVKNFNQKFDKFTWENNKKALKAWQKGQTGFPIVDAGMRQLWQTGYMHNRVRMIVASFLTKDLFIHWREGEKWFWDTLLDADIANNAASWQWVAGSGADAAPYFRIFNPTLQGKKFDPHGDYVRQWIPELKGVPDKFVHEPWLAENPPQNYPAPIVDHAKMRDKALGLYQQIK